MLRAAQFHEFVSLLMEWGTQGDVAYVPRMRTQLVAARTVAETLADLATAPEPRPSGPPFSEVAGPREESLVAMATLLAERRGYPAKVEAVSDPADRDGLNESGGLLPGPTPSWAARLSRTGSTRRTDCFRRAVARAGEVRRSRRLPVRVSVLRVPFGHANS